MPQLDLVLHLVLGADSTCYETNPMTFEQVVGAVRCGQYGDVHHVLALTFDDGVGSADDVTEAVAKKIFYQRGRYPIHYGGEAYKFVERVLSCRHAEMCAWEDSFERMYEQRRDMMREHA